MKALLMDESHTHIKINKCLKDLYVYKKMHINNQVNIVMTKIDVATQFLYLREPSHALYYFQQALLVQIELESQHNHAVDIKLLHKSDDLLYFIELLQHKIGLFEQSLELAHVRLASYKNSNISYVTVSDTMLTIGVLYKELGKYDNALYHFWQAYNLRSNIYESTNTPDDELLVLSDLFKMIEHTYYTAGYYNDALALCKIRLLSYKKAYISDNNIISDTMITMATLYEAIGEYEYTEYCLKKALVISRKLCDSEASLEITRILSDFRNVHCREENIVELSDYSDSDVFMLENNIFLDRKEVMNDYNCFFKAAAVELELPECMHTFLETETIQYMRNNLYLFSIFCENIESLIHDMEQKECIPLNIAFVQAFADVFCVNAKLYSLATDTNDFITIISRNNPTKTIHVGCIDNHYIALDGIMVMNNCDSITELFEEQSILESSSPIIGTQLFFDDEL